MNGSPASVRGTAQARLRRLGVETIDLSYQHRVDPAPPIEEIVAARARLVEESFVEKGKMRLLGCDGTR